MTKWKKFLRPLEKRAQALCRRNADDKMKLNKLNIIFGIFILAGVLIFNCGCEKKYPLKREDLPVFLKAACRKNYQAEVSCREVGDTLWVYLPYVPPGRFGQAKYSDKEGKLYLEYNIASFNPYRTIDPAELRFVAQKVIGEIRQLLLRVDHPYKFFVLVVTDITKMNIPQNEDWYIGYIEDIEKYAVGKDFSGEGYARLTWWPEIIKSPLRDKEDKVVMIGGKPVVASYRDAVGSHINYHDMTFREFVPKQIQWRVYKRFTIEYNKRPFDLSVKEKEGEILNIVNKVFDAYNFREFNDVYLKNMSFLEEEIGYTGKDFKKPGAKQVNRGPAF